MSTKKKNPSSTPKSEQATPSISPPEVGTALATPVPTVIDAPPTTPMPVSPVGFSPVDPEEFRGFRPRIAQVAVAPVVAAELKAATDYEMRFGAHAPTQPVVADAVDLAQQWRAIRTSVEAFLVYVQTEDALAWKNALTLLRELAPLFEAASRFDASVATEYPGLARFFEVPEVIAQQGSATRKKNAKTKAAKANAEAISTAVNAALVGQASAGTIASTTLPTQPLTLTTATSPGVSKSQA